MKKFKFSHSGKYLVIAGNMEMDTILIYDSSDIESLLRDKVAKRKYISRLQAPEIKDTQRIVFTKNDEKIFLGTNRQILSF